MSNLEVSAVKVFNYKILLMNNIVLEKSGKYKKSRGVFIL
jgi:hypothetical protein